MKPSGGNWMWIVAPVVALLAAAGWFWHLKMEKAKESAHRAACMSNHRQIGLAVKQYAEDHGGRHPHSFAILMKEGYITTWRVFDCPSVRTRIPDDFPMNYMSADLADLDVIDRIADYEMVRGLDDNSTPDFILLYERPTNHKGEGLNVGFVDGHVEWMRERDFQRLMKKQRGEMERMRAP